MWNLKKLFGAHFRVLVAAEKIVCYSSLAFLALIPCAESIMRIVFRSGIPSSSILTTHFLLVLGLFAGMIATKGGDHLSISVIQFIKNEKLKRVFLNCSCLLSAFITTILGFCSMVFIKLVLTPPQMIGFIPEYVFCAAMPIAYFVMAIRFAFKTNFTHGNVAGEKKTTWVVRILPLLPILLGVVFSLPLICQYLYQFDLPPLAQTIDDLFFNIAVSIKAPAMIVLFFAALTGTPLFIFLAGLSMLFFQSSDGGQVVIAANQIYTALTQDNFIAIPLFTLAGFFLSESKAGERLVTTFRSFFSGIPGGMIIASVIICAFFTSFTGASGVTILALGGILYTILCTNSGYPSKFSVGLLASCGSIGLLFPPSLPIIMVGTTLQTDIRKMFVAGVVPGLILTAAMIIFGIIVSIRTKIPREKFSVKHCVISVKGSFLELLLPVFLIAGYFSGALQLVELGAFAVLYTFVVEVFVYRDIKIKDLHIVFAKAIPIIGGILSILALSYSLSYYLVDVQLPQNFAHWMQNTITSKFVFLLLLNAALLVVGCLMDIFSAIAIILPLLFPFCEVYGIDPVHLGIIFLINMEAGFLTPPIGLNLFLASYRFNKPFVEICRCVMPFLLVQLAVVFLITYFAPLSTFVHSLFR
ncbi:MAG: TRAP transporter large permease subunit [Termitinemataceae bacterium]|nr:MAG: TRAP transporter large permease subunit [Termitinemataceae bacterium]